ACTGPALAAIQTLGASLSPDAATVARGTVLAIAYCLGLGVPFLLVAAGFGWVTRLSRWMRGRHRLVSTIGGVLLVVLGLLMVTSLLLRMLSEVAPAPGPIRPQASVEPVRVN